jgi:hypothetical protein
VGDEDCVAFSFCDVDVCAPVSGLADGSPCADPSECLSLQCVEGVCCDTACNLPCDSCALAGTEGACTTVPAGDPGEPTCAPHLCGAAGECGETCTTNADCATPFQCTKGTCGLDFALVRGWSEGQMLDPMNHAAKSRVWVETVSVLRIHLLSPTSNIDVVFYDPLGNEIDYDSAGALGMSYSRWYYGDPALSPSTTFGTRMGDMGYHVLLEVESPPAGLWEIKTTAIIPPAQVLPIRVGVETDGGAAIGAVTDKDDYLLTDSVVVFANLVNVDASPPTAITGATVKATFLQYNEGNDQTPPNVPDNPAYVELTLVDDGSGNDAVMNDGVYTGSTTLPVSSSYMLNVQAEGLDGFGQTFQRGATKNVRVQ